MMLKLSGVSKGYCPNIPAEWTLPPPYNMCFFIYIYIKKFPS